MTETVTPDLMLVVGCTASSGSRRFLVEPRVLVDMAVPVPDPMLTDAEMQSVCFAAKMALTKVLIARKPKRKR